MRIIAGSAKGRVLAQPAGVTRPTSDRTREGIFSSLESEIGACEGIAFLDLFGGTGAVGLEALSRGAIEVVVVEKDEKAAAVCRANYELVSKSTSGKFSVIRKSVDSFLELESSKAPLRDVVYIDPPYEMTNDAIVKLLEKIISCGILASDAIVIVERSSRTEPFQWPPGLVALKERKYGEGAVYFALSAPSS
jgi:16S rRNA (guanine966-N2)-methyltransferase